MESTKSYIDFLGIMKKSAEVAKYLQDLRNASKSSSFLMRNAAWMASCAADGLLVILRRIERELAGDNAEPPTVHGELFPPTPEHRTATIAEMRSIVDSWFNADYQEDDSGTPPPADTPDEEVEEEQSEEEAEPETESEEETKAFEESSLPAQIKYNVYVSGEDGLSDDDVFDSFIDSETDEELLNSVLWAMIHTGELQVQYPAVIYRASSPDLTCDVLAMIEAQPELGTEDGLPEDEIVLIPIGKEDETEGGGEAYNGVPDLTYVVSQWVHANTPTTRLDVLNHFLELGEDDTSIVTALEWLINRGTLEVSEGTEDKTYVHPAGLSPLDALEGDDLREVYEQLTGREPGRKYDKTLRREIAAIQDGPAEVAEDAPIDDDVGPQAVEGEEEPEDDMERLF